MAVPDVVGFLDGYAQAIGAPIETGVDVTAVARAGDGYSIETTKGRWQARAVVVATGYCDVPRIPASAARLAREVVQVVPTAYRGPASLPAGNVLIVGASSTGVQLADEIRGSGREVVLAVGRHTRLPRRYRGRDILWWLDAMGVLDETPADVYDHEISRRQPSLQLVGRPDHATLDLPMLQARGVRLTGRLLGLDGRAATFADDLVAHTAAADVRLARLLERIDEFITRRRLAAGPPEPFTPFLWPEPSPAALDLRAERIGAVIWATGFNRRYPWLQVPVLDAAGEIVHQGGVTAAPGLYVLGLHFQRRRKSSFLDGVGADARELAAHLAARTRRAVA
jgi:putative flavoprotein involved in K+ transport